MNLVQKLNETLEQCDVACSEQISFSSIRENLRKVEQYIDEGKLDRALLFANMVSEDAIKLIQDISENK